MAPCHVPLPLTICCAFDLFLFPPLFGFESRFPCFGPGKGGWKRRLYGSLADQITHSWNNKSSNKKHMPVRLIKHREYSGLPLRPTVSIKLPLACFRRFHVGSKFTDKIVYFCVSRATKKKNAWNQREGGIIFPTLAHFNCMHISRNELKVTDKRHVPERQ